MNLKQIQELIKFVAKSGATEVDLEMGDVKICIKSPPKGKITAELPGNIVYPAVSPVQAPPVQAPPVQAPPVQAPLPLSNTDQGVQEVQVNESQLPESTVSSEEQIIIKSPIIGTFYRRPSPDKEPFINVGDTISSGDVVGIVEAMKLFNEIESEVSGTIIKVLVDDMSPVEYDQPLFLVAKS